jgi:hypothetical protein
MQNSTLKHDALVRQMMAPPIATPMASVTLADNVWNESFAIPDNCVRAEVVFDQKAFCMAGSSGTNPAQDGAPYFPNIRYPIPCGGDNNKIFLKNFAAGVNVTAELTFFCTE